MQKKCLKNFDTCGSVAYLCPIIHEKSRKMKLYITDLGDESVGIFAQTWTIEVPFEKDDADEKDLAWFKRHISEAYREFASGKLVADYDFEQEMLNND